MLRFWTLLGVLAMASVSFAAPPAEPNDWLLNPAPFKAEVREDAARHELVLENGLARRTLRLAPNAATIALDNLTSGESLLRAVSPEARLTINGTPFAIGGLTGQPIKNYLKDGWLAQLRATPDAYRFTGWKAGPIEARFAWKKRPEWLSRDLPWPPPGKHVVLTFAPPLVAPRNHTGPILFEEKFTGKLDAAWKLHVSDKHPRTSFSNEGKAGELFALPDTCVYAERAWPKETAVVELTLDAGDDTLANSWGPGLAIVCEDRIIACVARPNSGQFEVVDPERGETLVGKFDRAEAVTLRARLDNGRVILEASQKNQSFQQLADIALLKLPTALRVGKVGKAGRGEDYDKPLGEPKRSHLLNVTLRGAAPQETLTARADLPQVEVHYELYDGLPLFSKWLVVKNDTKQSTRVETFVAEELRLAEVESTVEAAPKLERPNLWVETDYAYGAMDGVSAAIPTVKLAVDPDYPTQVNYALGTPCLLTCQPPLGPDQQLKPGEQMESFRVFELLLDSTERERRGLAQRRMYRTIAPWTAENPLMFHVRSGSPDAVRAAIEQCDQVGFEMIIMTFGSGFNFENNTPEYLATYKTLAAEAKAKGIALGGYSLLASRGADSAADNTQGQPAKYGVMPCLGSQWGQEYLAKLQRFLYEGGLGILEHDGSYPGDCCAATNHPGHRGLNDSQWVQWKAITDFYKQCRAEGVYLNIPDWYFLTGGSKCCMGYRETNWSLPRAEQEIIERQNIYDGTWTKTQSMGWMMVPLTEYHGGGAAATIEPLHQHLDHYEARFANLIGAGAQACYRGPRLYDTDETKAVVKKWVTFYKTHREVLDGDLIHLRRANGRDWDGWLHVNPQGQEKALAFFYNPLPEAIEREIRLPLYYAGLGDTALASFNGEPATEVTLDRAQIATLKVKIPAGGRTWVLLTDAP
ncbi:MAG TPA: hypothetical protein VL096_21980 [Pirellulaceae bacterium]|nr:hypothetical protein [Pirellulaceae bacterium]